MLSLYNPATGTFQPSAGGASPNMDINILIELRVMNLLLLAQVGGADTLESLRSDVVNDTANPII